MPLDLLLINPGGSRLIYQDLSRDLAAIEPPLWCRLIAGYCKDRGHSVEILDAEAMGLSAKGVASWVAGDDSRLVCIVAHGHQPSASTQQMYAAGETARAIKQRKPYQRIAITGGHVSALPERTLAEEDVDYVCAGEGPVTIECLLRGDLPSGIAGLGWRGVQQPITCYPGGIYVWEPRFNPPPPKLADLDADLHGNVWDLLPMRQYRAHNWQCFDGSPRQPYASIHTTLGCPYACSFCCINAPFGGPGYRRRSPDRVVAEVRQLYNEYGVRTLKIADEMFVLNPKHYGPICEGLAALPFADELNIWAYARVDTVKPDTLALLRRAGIRWLCLGIESASAHVRDGAKKSIDDDDIRETVKTIQDAGISVLGNFIFGLPDDTLETMQATLDLAMSLDLEYANFYSAMAYPGSRLFKEARPEDLPAAWSGYSQHSLDTTPLPTATLTSAEVLGFRDAAFWWFFASGGYLENIDRKFGSRAVSEIEAMVAVDLPREAA